VAIGATAVLMNSWDDTELVPPSDSILSGSMASRRSRAMFDNALPPESFSTSSRTSGSIRFSSRISLPANEESNSGSRAPVAMYSNSFSSGTLGFCSSGRESVALFDIDTFVYTTAGDRDPRVYLVTVIGDVHVVGDGVLVAVFHDQVLIKEADGLLRRCGGKADEIGVEVFEHLAPEIVDGAVAFIGNDEVEGLDRDVRVVNDRRRLFPKRLAELVAGAFVDLGVDL